MASKKDLIEAQTFSRNRLLSAFTGGAPDGKELEPAKPMRAVIAGVAITAMIFVVGAFYNLRNPALPDGWDNASILMVKDTGARYYSKDKVLYPVPNTTSARLLSEPGQYSVLSTSSKQLKGIEVGPAVGIPLAPDTLPLPGDLINTKWSACINPSRTRTTVSLPAPASVKAATGKGIVARNGNQLYVIIGSYKYPVAQLQNSSVLRAIGFKVLTPVDVTGRWLDTFEESVPLAPLEVVPRSATAEYVPGLQYRVGQAIHIQGQPADERFVFTSPTEMASLSPFAYQLYLLGTGSRLGGAKEVPAAAVANIKTAPTRAGALTWPTAIPEQMTDDLTICALMTKGSAADGVAELATSDTDVTRKDPVVVRRGGGALVKAADSKATVTYLIDQTGIAYPAAEDSLAKLGYATKNVAKIGNGWMEHFSIGPLLSYADAIKGMTVSSPSSTATTQATSSASPTTSDAAPTGDSATDGEATEGIDG